MTKVKKSQNYIRALLIPSMNDVKDRFPLTNTYQVKSLEYPYLDPEFTKFQYDNNVYQVYTKEFLTTLTSYLFSKVLHYFQEYSVPITILEVGAGDGQLSLFLRETLAELIADKKLTIIATDNKDWEKKGGTNTDPKNHVLNLDYKKSLDEYAKTPTILISCWMNVNVDWTEDFRTNEQVKEYIMIGDLFRTANFGKGWFLPDGTNFTCRKLSQEKNEVGETIINGLLGRFDGSPHNPCTRTEVFSFTRNLR